MLQKIHWLGHASFRIDGSKTVYIDPWKLSTAAATKKADIILITHSHYDHLSEEDVNKIQTPETVIIIPADGASQLSGQIEIIRPGQKIEKAGITVEAVPAYNINKTFHPKANGWVGYVLTIDGVRIYHSGDTDFVPEMKNLQNIDIALMAIGGTYTMDAVQAAEAVNVFQPKLAVPMHWGDIVGSEKDVETFKAHAEVPVKVYEQER